MNKYIEYLGKLATFSKDAVEYNPSLQHLAFKIVGVKKNIGVGQLPFLVEFEHPINEFTHRAPTVNNREYWLYGHCNTPEWLADWCNRPCLYRFLGYSDVQFLEN